MTIVYFGTYEENYSRNQIMIKALKKLGHTVKECHVSLWGQQIDKTKTFAGISNKIRFLFRLLFIYPRLFIKYLFIGSHDILFVGYFGHLDMIFVKLFKTILFRKKKIVFDAFLSLYDSMVIDRKMVKESSFLARFVYWLDKTACSFANLIILDTNAHIDFFHNTFSVPNEKMVRVFASADTDIFYPRKIKRNDDNYHVLFMGKYTPLHGIEHIVEAADILKNDKNIKFTFIGKGQLYIKIRKMVEEKQLDNIHFIEWVNYEKLPEYIAEADVCLGIFSDSKKADRVIPNKVFQSLAMGKPVITGRTTGSNECLLHLINAFLCNVADAHDLANAITTLKEDRQLRDRIAQKARETFETRLGERAVKTSIQDALSMI